MASLRMLFRRNQKKPPKSEMPATNTERFQNVLLDLPKDIKTHLLDFLRDPSDLNAVRASCRLWREFTRRHCKVLDFKDKKAREFLANLGRRADRKIALERSGIFISVQKLSRMYPNTIDISLGPDYQIASSGILFLHQFANVQSLDMGYSHLQPEAIVELSTQLPFLTHFSLAGGITAEGLQSISHSMRKLQSLRLWFLLDVSESTLTFCLSLLTDLQSLELQQMGYLDGKYDFLRAELHQHLTRLTLSGFGLLRGDAMIPIASLRNLKELFLDGDLIDDESLRHLTSLSNLHSLTLYSAPISNLGLKSIASLTNIESLHLGYCQRVTDVGLHDHLHLLTNLTSLSLSHMPSLSDSGLQELSVLPKLHRLDLTGSFGNHHPLQNGNRKK